MSIEERLREILTTEVYFKDLHTGGKEEACEKAIPKIIQAFKDEGWISPDQRDIYIDQVIKTAKLAFGTEDKNA